MAASEHDRLVIGSRKSALAMWQTRHIADRLRRAWPGLSIEVRTYVTEGDRNLQSALPEIGGKGLFTAQLEQALASREIDLAVHSLKDLPVESDDGLVIGAITSRTEVRDCVVARGNWTLDTLPRGAVVGTSSMRRQAQVLARRPDLTIRPIRGNVETRVRKVREGQYDAAILAGAGLSRLGMSEDITAWIPVDDILPAPGQGALAVQCRAGDEATLRRLEAIDEPDVRTAVTAERTFLQELGGGCSAPIAAYATVEGNRVSLSGLVSATDGGRVIRVRGEGEDGVDVAKRVADAAMSEGAASILEEFRRPAPREALGGLRVVVTRPREQAEELCRRLAGLGAVPICAPAIRIEQADDPGPLDDAIRDLARFDWVAFSSASAVEIFRQRWMNAGRAGEDLGVKVAAVGTATARALADWGVRVDFLPDRFVGDALARMLPLEKGERVLFPRARDARKETVEVLAARGAEVVDLAIYRTVPDAIPPAVLADIQRGVDAVLFTSESSVVHFTAAVQGRVDDGLLERARIVCIGPVTADAVRRRGLRVDAVADVHTTDGLLETLVEAFSKGGVSP